MKRFLYDKKGIVQAITDTGIALIILFIGLLILLWLTKYIDDDKKENGAQVLFEVNANYLSSLYLKQKVFVDGSEMSMFDLAVLAAANKDQTSEKYFSLLKRETNLFFSDSYSSRTFTAFVIKLNDQIVIQRGEVDLSVSQQGEQSRIGVSRKNPFYAKVFLPSNENKNDVLEIIMSQASAEIKSTPIREPG